MQWCEYHQFYSLLSEPSEWKLHSSSTLWSGLERCWTDEVYLPSLLHRFWKLSLQQMARHAAWLDQIYDDEVSRAQYFRVVSKAPLLQIVFVFIFALKQCGLHLKPQI